MREGALSEKRYPKPDFGQKTTKMATSRRRGRIFRKFLDVDTFYRSAEKNFSKKFSKIFSKKFFSRFFPPGPKFFFWSKWPKIGQNGPKTAQKRILGISLAIEGVFLHFIYTFPTILSASDRFMQVLGPDSTLFSHFGGPGTPGRAPEARLKKFFEKFFSKK